MFDICVYKHGYEYIRAVDTVTGMVAAVNAVINAVNIVQVLAFYCIGIVCCVYIVCAHIASSLYDATRTKKPPERSLET